MGFNPINQSDPLPTRTEFRQDAPSRMVIGFGASNALPGGCTSSGSTKIRKRKNKYSGWNKYSRKDEA